MKKLLSAIISLGLAVSAVPAITASANINVNDEYSDAYQELMSQFTEIAMPYFMSHYESTGFDTYYASADGTTYLAVAELTPAILLNTAEGVTVNDVNNALITYNAEADTRFSVRTRTLLSYDYDLKCELTVGGSTDVFISVADAKSLCSYLMNMGLISDFTYVANRIEYREGYLHTPTSYYKCNTPQGDETFDTLSAYVAENALECTVIKEDTDGDDIYDYVTVQPDTPLTLQEHIALSEKIYSDTQIYPALEEPVTLSQQNGTDIDILNSVEGDANNDGAVGISDVTYIMQSISDSDNYALDAQQTFNADVTGGNDGITAEDALVIQKYLAGQTDTLG